MTKLKPCPFCGGEGVNLVTEYHGVTVPQVTCTKSSCYMSFIAREIEKWNTRPIEDEQAEQITLLADEIASYEKALGNAQTENQRLKECAELGLEANSEKAKEIARLKELVCRAIKYADIQREYELVEEIEQALAAQPQGGSDEVIT